jgi:hypothetical protein
MPRPSRDDWDTPGGPGGLEALGQLRGPAPGAARALYHQWQEAMYEIVNRSVLKHTVSPQIFNTFRRARLDTGITDDQLAGSFQAFATHVAHGLVSVYQGDLWRTYASSWQRWVSIVPTGRERPLSGRQRGSTREQR